MREGPAIPIMGITIGFWDGLPQYAICSEITQSPEKFWYYKDHIIILNPSILFEDRQPE